MFDPNSPSTILNMAPKMGPEQLAQMARQHAKSPNGALWAGFALAARKRQQAAQAAQPPAPTVAAQLGLDSEMPENQGIARLPAPNMQFAEGGVVGFAGGGGVSAKEKFYQQMFPIASQAGAELGVDPNILIAQWGLETGWGERIVGANNYGNIKDPSGKGRRAFDRTEGSNDAYREYASPGEFAKDYASLVKRNFPSATGAGADVGRFSSGLASGRVGPYATEPTYGSRLASTLTSLMPIASAQAQGASAAPPAGSASLVNQIPGMERSVDPTTGPQPQRSVGERVIGGLEALANLGTSGLAAPVAYGNAVLHGAAARMAGLPEDEVMREAEQAAGRVAGRMVRTPRTGAGVEETEALQRALRDSKIPPFIPGLAVGSPRMPSAGTAANAAARAAQAESALTGPVANTASAQLAAAMRAATHADAAGAAAHAGAQAARAGALTAQGSGLLARLRAGAAATGAGMAGSAAGASPAASGAQGSDAPVDTSVGHAARGAAAARQGEIDAQQQVNPAQAIDMAKRQIPEEKRKGWTDDMLMMFFLQMMAGKSRHALQNIGDAGLGAMQYGMEAKKADRAARLDAANERLIDARIRVADANLGAERNDIQALKVQANEVSQRIKEMTLLGGRPMPGQEDAYAKLIAQRDAIHAKLQAISSQPDHPEHIRGILARYGRAAPVPE